MAQAVHTLHEGFRLLAGLTPSQETQEISERAQKEIEELRRLADLPGGPTV